jgi:hypothetical protein
MQPPKPVFFLLLTALLTTSFCQAQVRNSFHVFSITADTLRPKVSWQTAESRRPFNLKPFFVPGLMIMYGFGAIENDGLQNANKGIKEEIWTERPHQLRHIDNYLQFVPAAAVYGLNAMGIKGKHNFRDRTMIYLMANIINNVSIFSLKKFSHQLRPDGSAFTSFPSGHTAEAFANAEFLRQEYKDVSPWYGIAGYAVAATTGYLRIYNNKHWLSDVVTGAGIGITSTKLAYWLYPKLQHKFFKNKPVNTVVMPTFQNGGFGVGMVHRF